MPHIVSADVPGRDSIQRTIKGDVSLKPNVQIRIYAKMDGGLNEDLTVRICLFLVTSVEDPIGDLIAWEPLSDGISFMNLIEDRQFVLSSFAAETVRDMIEAAASRVLQDDGHLTIAHDKRSNKIKLAFEFEGFTTETMLEFEEARSFLHLHFDPS